VIFHASIPADEPERVARVIAELWRGTYRPFIAPNTVIVLAGDEYGTELEIGPRGGELYPAESAAGFRDSATVAHFNAVHINMSTVLTYDEAFGYCRAGGVDRTGV
jgi:hypothetical protein